MATEPIARLEARLPTKVYALLKRAVELRGRSSTDFVVNAAQDAAQDAAQRVIEDDSIIRLSAEHQSRFAQAPLGPPAPKAALKLAMSRHRKNVDVR